MKKNQVISVTDEWRKNAFINENSYSEMYKESVENSDQFWAKQAKRIQWIKPWNKVSNSTFDKELHVEWFSGAKLNVSANCIDRHLEDKAEQVAFTWVPEDSSEKSLNITYSDLHKSVCKLSNALKANGVKKGDRVTIYLPMIPEAIYSMLACARIGAIHSVVFAGFSPDSLANRIQDCDSEYLITADEGIRGKKAIPLKVNADAAADMCPDLKKMFVVNRMNAKINWNPDRDVWYHEAIADVDDYCPPETMDAEDPLFILYTSGSTNKPKGVMHTSGGYLVYASLTHQLVFDYKPGDMYWCAADVGWVTGHSYIVYGPLANGATSLIYEGLPTCPDASRIWKIVDEYKVNTLYTAPTLIRTLMSCGDDFVKSSSRKSLRLLGTVGEPINPEAWRWYHEVIGESRCPIVDTWWQTETGGIMITPLPGATSLKPGSATNPFFGIQPVIVDDQGKVLEGECEGNLCIKSSWPGQMRTVYKDHKRFFETYFSQFPGMYFTGDGCRRDKDGYYWITGRVDDVLNVSGHRIGTAEVESALVNHKAVAEAAVVGFPHEIKGQAIYAFVTLMSGKSPSEDLRSELVNIVRKDIGPFAAPEKIQFAPALPKTRSGKIMRRILRKLAGGEFEELGDTSTLAEPKVVEQLIENRL